MLKKILIAVVVVVAIVVGLASRQPDIFSVSRSITINAPAEAIFPHINNLVAMNAWSPWAERDPDATITPSGPQAGVGATLAWSGNSKVGEGVMSITNSLQNEAVTYKLQFVRPMESTATSAMTLRPEGTGTLVTWRMDGTNNFVAKVVTLFMNCEKMVGEQYDIGLANLKNLVESAPSAPATVQQ